MKNRKYIEQIELEINEFEKIVNLMNENNINDNDKKLIEIILNDLRSEILCMR